MKIKLLIRGILAIIGGVVMVMLPLYLSAGTVDYPHMWLMAAVLFIPMLLMGIVMFVKAPDLLEKRLKNKETEDTQKTVILLAFFMLKIGGL